MIISRGLYFTKLSSHLGRNLLGQSNKNNVNHQIIRNSGGQWYYRKSPEATRSGELFAKIAGTIFWWWVIWHLLTDYHELLGGHSFPDPSQWTDEELGIPPDE